MTHNRNLFALVGNGLSIGFNPDLALTAITAEMLRRIKGATDVGDDVVTAMREIAERALPEGASSDNDFEVLVGAFGAESRTLQYLQRLAELSEPKDDDLRTAIERVAAFAEEVRDNGISHVLEVIFERSHAYLDESAQLHSFVQGVVDAFDGRVTFANLNYDTLLLAALLAVCHGDLADMGHGWRKVVVKSKKAPDIRVPSLRASKAEFPEDKRVRLLHLHGSVTFWANAKRTVFVKLDRSFFVTRNQWEAVRTKSTNLRPVVVLAHQRDKSAHVLEHPFAMAYEMSADALGSSDFWLVVGYSFRDVAVNEVLREKFLDRDKDSKPKVLVVTMGSELKVTQIERAFGWGKEDGDSANWLTVERSGALGLETTSTWAEFVGA